MGAPVAGLKAFGVAVVLLALAGCGEQNTYVPPPAPKVTVAAPIRHPVRLYIETTGSSAAVNNTDLVARVSGFVEKINYNDGDLVKKGTLLFSIEPDTYALKLKQAQAAEEGARATLKQAEADFQRQSSLGQTNAVSKSVVDTSLSTRDNARASLTQAEINTKLAELNVAYSNVTAPYDGIVTARKISIGEYVGGTSTPTQLATIVQLNPVWVNFNINENDVLRVRAEIKKRGLTPDDLKKVPVEVGLQNEDGYPHRGHLDYAAPNVDNTTGTLAARAILDNADRAVLPGMFVRVRVPTGTLDNAMLVPEVALGSDQSGRYVLVVNKDNVVEQRKVEVGPADGTLRVIDKGLAADDRVVVDGLLRAIPGQKVDPHTATAAPSS